MNICQLFKRDYPALVWHRHARPALALAQPRLIRALLRDTCCSDHDGGDRDDDGLLTVSSVGQKVTVVTFTRGNIVRYVSRIPLGMPTVHSAR